MIDEARIETEAPVTAAEPRRIRRSSSTLIRMPFATSTSTAAVIRAALCRAS
jgi:hypothetical protein